MSMPARRTFWIAFATVILVIAGGLSYLASTSPDGLDAATRQGCQVVETTDGSETLVGDCMARHATDHTMASSPLADYAIGGRPWTGGLAGIVGALVTLALAVILFRMIARRRPGSSSER